MPPQLSVALLQDGQKSVKTRIEAEDGKGFLLSYLILAGLSKGVSIFVVG